jgi:hypothetical protein
VLTFRRKAENEVPKKLSENSVPGRSGHGPVSSGSLFLCMDIPFFAMLNISFIKRAFYRLDSVISGALWLKIIFEKRSPPEFRKSDD